MNIQNDFEGIEKDIETLQLNVEDEFLHRENVVGVSIGKKIRNGIETDESCLTVYVENKVSTSQLSKAQRIPKSADKITTDVVESGVIFAGDQQFEDVTVSSEEAVGIQTLRKRVRPVEGGYSVGHPNVTAGTYATAVMDSRDVPGIPKRYYLLSNNHVIANSNDARIGDPIIQPGRLDGGTTASDVIARLSRFVPLKFGGPKNYVDAAIAEGRFDTLDREIYWIGHVDGVSTVKVGDFVHKTGRTTNYTTGKVTGINATINVNYGGGRTAKMVHQIVTSSMSAGGDSGSLVCNLKDHAVGLLFAGSSQLTVVNDIRYVQSFLGISVAL